MKLLGTFETHVAGTNFRNIPDDNSVMEYDEVELIPEPENKWDSKAIKVVTKRTSTFVGYIPKNSTNFFHNKDLSFECSLGACTAKNNKVLFIKLNVNVYLNV
jgi:hypothetical protein